MGPHLHNCRSFGLAARLVALPENMLMGSRDGEAARQAGRPVVIEEFDSLFRRPSLIPFSVRAANLRPAAERLNSIPRSGSRVSRTSNNGRARRPTSQTDLRCLTGDFAFQFAGSIMETRRRQAKDDGRLTCAARSAFFRGLKLNLGLRFRRTIHSVCHPTNQTIKSSRDQTTTPTTVRKNRYSTTGANFFVAFNQPLGWLAGDPPPPSHTHLR